MFLNIFPKSLTSLIRQQWPKHRFSAVMLPLVSPDAYCSHTADFLPEQQLVSDTELAQARSYPMAKRQNEWLTGRLSGKLGVIHYLQNLPSPISINPCDIFIGNDAAGRPEINSNLLNRDEPIHLSLSHGAGYGAAMTSESHCGIDVQKSRQTLIKVSEKFCSPVEEEMLLDNLVDYTRIQYLTMLWSAKEAAQKSLSHIRLPGFLELMLTETDPHMNGWIFTFMVSSRNFSKYPPTAAVAVDLYNSFGIAACIKEKA